MSVSGYTEGSLGGPSVGSGDAWLAHYNGAGNQIWIRQFGTTRFDLAFAAAPDGAGGVFVGGQVGLSPNGGGDAWLAHYGDLIATRYCTPAISNSTGQPGVLTAFGSNAVVANDLTAEASQLPPNSFGFFLTSRTQGLAMGPGGAARATYASGARSAATSGRVRFRTPAAPVHSASPSI